jgi:hypothetical protein
MVASRSGSPLPTTLVPSNHPTPASARWDTGEAPSMDTNTAPAWRGLARRSSPAIWRCAWRPRGPSRHLELTSTSRLTTPE